MTSRVVPEGFSRLEKRFVAWRATTYPDESADAPEKHPHQYFHVCGERWVAGDRIELICVATTDGPTRQVTLFQLAHSACTPRLP
jgi:hypothetical protein